MYRFTEGCTENVLGQFKLLFQQGTINDSFERQVGCLKSYLCYQKDFIVGSFVGGLAGETKKMVKLLEPKTLVQAYMLAIYYETSVVNSELGNFESKMHSQTTRATCSYSRS